LPLTLTELKHIIETAGFDKLVGEVEGQFFDAKSQPYRFGDGAGAKREFAKDVAAFANTTGGIIIIGLHTKTGPLHTGEEIDEVRPIPGALFDPDQHRKILAEWLFPQPAGVEISWTPFGLDPNKGVGAILIPLQDDSPKPFLIRRSIGENKKTSELLIGYVERRIDATDIRTIEELHHALKTGLNLERELLGRIANLETLIEKHFSAKAAVESLEQRDNLLNQRIARMIDESRS
jgi:hypothetical protein